MREDEESHTGFSFHLPRLSHVIERTGRCGIYITRVDTAP